jgi:hypothetical protein
VAFFVIGGSRMAFTGEGLRNVLIVSQHDWMNDHGLLHRMINRSGGLDKSHFKFASLQTPGLLEGIKREGIKTVVGLGEPVLRQLLGEKDILRWRGRAIDWMGIHFVPAMAPGELLPRRLTDAQKAQLRAQGITPVNNPPRFQGTWMRDVEFAQLVAKQGFTRTRANYTVDVSPQEFEAWAQSYFAALALDPFTWLSWDVETVYKQKARDEDEYEESETDTNLEEGSLLRISFSFAPFTGVSVPWSPEYFGTIRRLLASAGRKVVWNGITFDVPVVEKAGFTVGGVVYDFMDGWHVYQSDLPKGLEFVTSYATDLLPWKHLNNSDPGLYSAIDADAALRNAIWIERELRKTGQWHLFENLYVRLAPVLTSANKRGNYIDIQKRDELRAEMMALIAEKVEEIQPMVPREVKPRKVWLNPPVEGYMKFQEPGLEPARYSSTTLQHEGRDFDVVEVKDTIKVCTACNRIATNKSEHYANEKGEQKRDKDGALRFGKKGNPLHETIPNPCKVAGGAIEERPGIRFEYHEVEPFNPNSGDQLKTYARHFGHPIGQDARDSTKEAFDKAHIKELLNTVARVGPHYEFYSRVAEVKLIGKTLGTYIYDPDAEGLIHQTYKNAPSTPRLSGANKNLMNIGKREDNIWAVKARTQIVARPGHRFVQADSSAIEAVIQGLKMGDPKYMELATQSIHAWVVAKKNGIEWTGTEEQVSYLKANFKDDYNKMKTVNYLTNFGGGPYLMWKTDRKSFPTKESAERAQQELFRLMPSLPAYHHNVRSRAQKESFLTIPGWNYRHYYYDVFTQDKFGNTKLGKDAKRVVALYPQGSAALFLRENALLLGYGDEAAEWLGIEPLGLRDGGYREWIPANFLVHDGYTLEPPDGKEWEAAEALEKVLTRPIKQLDNLRVGCEIDISPVGGNWGPADPVKNPNGLVTVKTVRVQAMPDGYWERRAA